MPTLHITIPIKDIEKTQEFYADGLGGEVGNKTKHSILINFYGHQLVGRASKRRRTNPKNGWWLPSALGVNFPDETSWNALLEKAKEHNLSFYIEPHRRYKGQKKDHIAVCNWKRYEHMYCSLDIPK